MERYRLGDICEIVSGSTPKTNINEYWDGDVKWITPAELNDETYIITDSVRKITELGVKRTGLTPLPEGTVILSSRAPIGKVAIAGCEMYCNQGFKNLICSDKINNRYLYWFLKGNNTFLNSLGRGATFKEISKAIVANIEINVPDKEMQRQVVDNLEKISKIIRLRKQELQKLNELIKARFFEMFGDPIANDRGWKQTRVGDICFVTKLAGFEYTKYVNYENKGDVIMIRGLNVKEKKLKLDDVYYIDASVSDLLPRSQLKENDIVMTYVGINIGDVALVDGKHRYHLAPNVAKISLNSYDEMDPIFFVNLLAFNKNKFALNATNTAKQALNMNKIRKLIIMMPPIEIQKNFGQFAKYVDKSKVIIQKSLDEMQILFDSLMQKYFG